MLEDESFKHGLRGLSFVFVELLQGLGLQAQGVVGPRSSASNRSSSALTVIAFSPRASCACCARSHGDACALRAHAWRLAVCGRLGLTAARFEPKPHGCRRGCSKSASAGRKSHRITNTAALERESPSARSRSRASPSGRCPDTPSSPADLVWPETTHDPGWSRTGQSERCCSP